MGIMDDIQVVKSKKGSRCPIVRILDQLQPQDRSELVEALMDTSIEHTVLTDVLRSNGYNLGERAIGNHRRSLFGLDGTKCSCYPNSFRKVNE